MPLTVTVNNSPVTLLASSAPKINDTLDQRSTATFTVYDATGTLHLDYGMPVSITDSVAGLLFTGYVQDATETNMPPNAANTIAVSCFDQHYLADKRVGQSDYTNMYAGDIVVDQLENYLSAEGVTASYAQARDTTQTDFAIGILSGVVATDNVDEGNLELSPSGQEVTVVEKTTSAFAAGTLSGTTGFSNALWLQWAEAIKLTGKVDVTGGNAFTYVKIWQSGYTFQAGDTVNYDVWISSTSPQIQAAVDIVCTDGSTMRDISNQGCRDQFQLHAHPGTDLKGYADDQWYSRVIGTTALTGKTTSYATVAFEGDDAGTYTAYFRNVRIMASNGTTVRATLFGNGFQIAPQQMQDSGYSNTHCTNLLTYPQSGTRISPAYSLSAAVIARSSAISWTTEIPTAPNATNSTNVYGITVEASLDGGKTYQPCTSGAAIPGLVAGLNVFSTTLTLRETLTNNSTDPEQTPKLTGLQAAILPSYAGTKSDVDKTYSTSGNFNAGTYGGSATFTNGALTLNGVTRNWDDAVTSNQTQYGANSPTMFANNRQVTLQSFNNADVRSRLDFAGQWQNFVCEVDVLVGAFTDTAQNVGIVYRTTGWQNANDTYAYSVYVNTFQIVLAKGTNSGSGSGTFTTITSAGLSLTSGNMHRLKVVVNGNSHTVYLDDVQYLSATDATYTAAGYIGLRYYNAAGNMVLTAPGLTAGHTSGTVTVDYVSEPIGDATPIVIDLGSVNSETVYAYGAQAASATSVAIQITTDSAGSAHAQANATWAHNHATGALTTFPFTGSTNFDNFGVAASTTGTWTSPALSLTKAGIDWDSFVSWAASIPGTSTIDVQASLDGSLYFDCTNGAAIPAIARGYNLNNLNLYMKVTMNAPSVTQLPTLTALSTWVIGQITCGGSRVAPALFLNSVGRVGSTFIDWNANVPPNCNLFIETSLDGNNWTLVGQGATGGVPAAGIQGALDPIDDSFTTDTSSFYTSYFQNGGNGYGESLYGSGPYGNTSGGGNYGTWTWDTAHSRLVATNGNLSLLLLSSITWADVDLVIDSDTSDSGGLAWRILDSNNLYDLEVCDASSSVAPNTMTLYKVLNGSRSTLATASIAWTRGTPHRIRATMLGGLITVTFDGNAAITYTDHFPLAAGQAGMRTDAGSANFYKFRLAPQGESVGNTTLYTAAILSSTDPTVTPQLFDITTSVRSPAIQTGSFIPSTTYSVLGGSTNSIAQNLDDLAKQSSYWWRIDKNKQIAFQAYNATLAPFIITGADMFISSGVTVQRSGDLYRNTPWILGGTDELLITNEPVKTDGITQVFTLKHKINSINTLYDGATFYTFGVQGVDTGKDFYYTVGSSTLSQDSSELPLGVGTLQATYYGQVDVVASVQDSAEVTAMAAIEKGTSGIVEVAESAPGLDRVGAQQLAASREALYTPRTKTVNFTTARVGLTVGQQLSVFLAQHGLIDEEVLITGLQTTWRMDMLRGTMDATPYFTVTGVSGPLRNEWYTTLSGLGR